MKAIVLAAALTGSAITVPANAQQAQTDETTATVSAELREAWQAYTKAIEDARIEMESSPRWASNPQDRAKAYHTLVEMEAMAYNFIIAPRLTNPRIYRNISWQTDLYTLGQNGPDFDYRNLFVDGSQTYRLSGRTGATKLNLIQVFNGVFGEEGVKTIGNYDLKDFQVNPDGTFEIILGGPKRDGNWIPLDPEVKYQYVFFRRALVDFHDDPGELRIERVSRIDPGKYDADEFDEAAIAKRLRRAAGFVRYLVHDWNILLHDTYIKNAGGKNRMSLLPGTTTGEVGSPSSNYAMGVFHLEHDEALVVELPKAPNGVYWSFQLGDVWSRSLPFHLRQTSLNSAQTKIDADGGVRVVISKKDPGVANWLDTTGRIEGTFVLRNYNATSAPVPTTRKVKFSELAKVLPAGTAQVTPEQRTKDIDYRRDGYVRFFGE